MASKPQHKVAKPRKGGEKYRKSKGGPAYAVSFETGDAGIFISCDKGKEGKCAAEAMDLFTEYYENSTGKKGSSEVRSNNLDKAEDDDEDQDEDDVDVDIDDIEARIKREVEGLKLKASTPRLFQKVTVSIPCIVFFRIDKSIDPVKLVHDLCMEAKANPGQRRSRWIRRMTPVTQIRKMLSVNLQEFAKEILHPHFHVEGNSKTYAIRPTIRNNSTIDRDTVIKTVAEAVGDEHKVDLANPDRTILVDIFQNIIGMSVVDGDYDELKRFNLSEIYSPTPKPQPNSMS